MFEFSSSLFFWTLINFGILVVVLAKVALPNLFKMAEEHENQRQMLLRSLEEKELKARELAAQYEAKMAAADQEVRQIVESSRKEQEAAKKATLEKLLAEKQSALEGIKSEMRYEKNKVIQDIESNASQLIVATAGKILQKELSDRDHDALIRQSLQEFEKIVSA